MRPAKKPARDGARRSKKPARPARALGRGKYDRDKSPEERHGEQRLRLLAAAAQVFAARGFANASVRDIVTTAGMSRRTFYEHFTDLRDVLLQVHDRAASFAFRFVEERIRAAKNPEEKVGAGVTAFLSILAEQGDLARVLFREIRAAGPDDESRHEALLSRYVGLLFEGVADAYAKGAATRPPDELTIFALVAAMEAVAMRYVARHEEARAVEAAPTLIELIVRAFK
jgi:AcrR family transcriptional regulator